MKIYIILFVFASFSLPNTGESGLLGGLLNLVDQLLPPGVPVTNLLRKVVGNLDKVVNAIRKSGANWVAGINPEFAKLLNNLLNLNDLLGGMDEPDYSKRPTHTPNPERKRPQRPNHGGMQRGDNALPKTYDAREYAKCTSIGSIRYQYKCSSCWAITAASVMSDRHCIYTYQTTSQIYVSPMHIVSCIQRGCKGGKEWDAYDYWVKYGFVSGGASKTNSQPKGCLPYENISTTPATCPKSCSVPHNKTFEQDKSYGGDWYMMWSPSIEEIKKEIYNYGPVSAFFTAYEDFFYYTGGIYEYVHGDFIGYHVAKLIGWGTENGVPYWLAANTWGTTNWGEGGFFKIRMGVNEVGIEDRIGAVLPREAF